MQEVIDAILAAEEKVIPCEVHADVILEHLPEMEKGKGRSDIIDALYWHLKGMSTPAQKALLGLNKEEVR